MLITVMLITSAILSATSISALIILFQLKQVSDIKASTQAIFAADSGLECLLYERVKGGEVYSNCGKGAADGTGGTEIVLTNDSYPEYRASYTVIDEGGGLFKSIGRSAKAARAFEIGL